MKIFEMLIIEVITKHDSPWPSIFTRPDMMHIFLKIEGQFKKK